jgi:hypothetical protein
MSTERSASESSSGPDIALADRRLAGLPFE